MLIDSCLTRPSHGLRLQVAKSESPFIESIADHRGLVPAAAVAAVTPSLEGSPPGTYVPVCTGALTWRVLGTSLARGAATCSLALAACSTLKDGLTAAVGGSGVLTPWQPDQRGPTVDPRWS
jgi:hypothetical protein